MNEEPEPPRWTSAVWWLVWLLSTAVLPAIAGTLALEHKGISMRSVALVVVSLGLHGGSCVKLDQKFGCLIPFLILGGWMLMAAAFFAGCLSLIH